MVVKQKPTPQIPRKDMQSADVFEYLSSMGVPPAKMNENSDLDIHIWEAADTFGSLGFHNFSSVDIAMLMYQNQWNPETRRLLTSRVSDRIRTRYKEHFKTAKDDMNLTWVHFLRMETGNHRGNLERVFGYELQNGLPIKKTDPIYPDLQVSYIDWQEGARIVLPKGIDEKVVSTLGYLWSHAYTISYTPKYRGISIPGEETLRQFLLSDVKDALEDTFNLAWRVVDYSNRDVSEIAGKELQLAGIELQRTSMAVTSYLETYLGFNALGTRNNLGLPRIPWTKENKLAFVKSFVNLDGYSVREDGWGNSFVQLTVKGERISRAIFDMAKDLGYSCYGFTKSSESICHFRFDKVSSDALRPHIKKVYKNK